MKCRASVLLLLLSHLHHVSALVRTYCVLQPADWDDQPAQIPDPDATKPDDWSEEDDGEWEAPLIENPNYKGEWKAPMIDNPAYKGVWKAKQIPNPKYVETVAVYDNIGAIGFEVSTCLVVWLSGWLRACSRDCVCLCFVWRRSSCGS